LAGETRASPRLKRQQINPFAVATFSEAVATQPVALAKPKFANCSLIRIARSGAFSNDQFSAVRKFMLSCDRFAQIACILARGGLPRRPQRRRQNIWRVRDGLRVGRRFLQVFEPNSRMVCNILILARPRQGAMPQQIVIR